MISKELYEEVQKDYIDFKNITQDEYIIIFNKEEETVEYVNKHTLYEADSISIYKLAHKCKEWALLKGYYFSIYSFNFSFNTEQEHRIRLLLGNEVVYWGNDSCEEIEPEIFAACQWVLENK